VGARRVIAATAPSFVLVDRLARCIGHHLSLINVLRLPRVRPGPSVAAAKLPVSVPALPSERSGPRRAESKDSGVPPACPIPRGPRKQ
jgi:hypothetical protein